jgi:hypothetical protein
VLAPCELSGTKVNLVGLEGLCMYVLYNTKPVRMLVLFVSKPFYVCLFFFGTNKLVVYYVMLLFYLLVTESFHTNIAL